MPNENAPTIRPMRRRDHQRIAEALRTAFEQAACRHSASATRQEVVDRVCDALFEENPHFRADLFRHACQPQQIVAPPPLSRTANCLAA